MPKRTEKRTQIYLTAEQHQRTLELARQKKTSMAGIVREALEQYLNAQAAGDRAAWQNDPVLECIGRWKLPEPLASDLNEEIDRVVYE